MTLYAADEDGACICVDCIHGRCVSSLPCEAEHCRCECGRESDAADRARELDDRPAETLASVARDMEAEARPDVAELVAERFGGGRRGT